MSKNEIGWDGEHQLVVNRKVHHGSRVIYKPDLRSYDRAKTHMIGQNLVARSS